MSRAFAEHWAPRGVLVNAVAPGPAATELWTGPGGMGEQIAARQGTTVDAAIENLGGQLPLGRVAQAGEIADVITFLCSDRCSTVVGAAWSADGGAVRSIL
ncbi:MAG: SDR family oxidoreductase [Patulibacter minatonensis]